MGPRLLTLPRATSTARRYHPGIAMPHARNATLGISGLVALALIILIARLTGVATDQPEPPPSRDPTAADPRTADHELVEQLFRSRSSGVMVTVRGTVIKLLPDDADGAAHQRFLLELDTRRTLLVAHNIDLAPRVPLAEGDHAAIRAQYEWTERGGTLHWTHHDPDARREGGWILHDGQRYE